MKKLIDNKVEISVLVGSEPELESLKKLFEDKIIGIFEGSAEVDLFEHEVQDHDIFFSEFPKLISLVILSRDWEKVEKSSGLKSFRVKKITRADNKDYVKEFYESFDPISIGSKFVICSSWNCDTKFGNKIKILMDPSSAFGTGDHPTTQMCVSNIEFVAERISLDCFLDVGTGSGVLAIAADKLLAKKLYACDIDENALTVAKQNFSNNEVKVTTFLAKSNWWKKFDRIKFDLLVSNIVLQANLEYRKTYVKLIKQGGFLIISGILPEQKGEIIESYKNEFQLILISEYKDSRQAWINFVFKKI